MRAAVTSNLKRKRKDLFSKEKQLKISSKDGSHFLWLGGKEPIDYFRKYRKINSPKLETFVLRTLFLNSLSVWHR